MRRRLGGRARAAGLVEFAVVLPTFLLLVLGIAQFGLWYHAQGVVLASAREAAQAAALEGATPEEGAAVAQRLLALGLGRLAADVRVEAAADAEVAVVAAEGRLAPIVPLPGIPAGLPLRARAVSYREGFRP